MIAFGPVPSRRLGKSLGINNIVTHKVCSYSCIYCQIGNTAHKSIERTVFYDPKKLIRNIEDHLIRLDKDHKPDYLTFVPNGEPTLDINLGEEIIMLKKFGIPIAVITNASLIYDDRVQADLMGADWVSVKVDAVDKAVWNRINRPLDELHLSKILEGLHRFASIYRGNLNTETMLVQGINDSTGLLKQNASFIAGLRPQKAYLSIPTRPPAVREIRHVSGEKLTEAWKIYTESGLQVELLTGFEGTDTGFTGNAIEDVLNITAVHPLRKDAMDDLLNKENADQEVLISLLSQGLIKSVRYNGRIYYLRNYLRHTI
jgi:wyosine [tRNA(Phe)-imidazoG37] synthetase (radical SAM superfamily)